MVERAEGGYERAREDLLTRDLALYLFDQGVVALFRVRFGKHELDLLEADVQEPIFIEAKVYIDSTAKSDLIEGIAQLHSYLSGLEAYKQIHDCYYVIYRLGGPIYEFPERIATNRFTIYPVLVDLGLSDESGSKQPKPILVTEAEVLNRIADASDNAEGLVQPPRSVLPERES